MCIGQNLLILEHQQVVVLDGSVCLNQRLSLLVGNGLQIPFAGTPVTFGDVNILEGASPKTQITIVIGTLSVTQLMQVHTLCKGLVAGSLIVADIEDYTSCLRIAAGKVQAHLQTAVQFLAHGDGRSQFGKAHLSGSIVHRDGAVGVLFQIPYVAAVFLVIGVPAT